MALIKHNNNSISAITALPSGIDVGGPLVFISEQTASGSASVEFTSGIDSTYDIYKIQIINANPATDNKNFEFNLSSDGGSNYNVTKTSSFFQARHDEAGTSTNLAQDASGRLAQSTANQRIAFAVGNNSDQSVSGELYLFNPSSTTYVKHYICVTNSSYYTDHTNNNYIGGYANTTSAVNAIKFVFASGNFDGTFKLYGIK